MLKGKFLVFSIIFLVLSSAIVNADLFVKEEIDKNYITDYEKITYVETLYGKTKGFTLTISSTSPKYYYAYEDEYPYVTWGYISPRGSNYNKPNYGFFERERNYDLEQALYTYRLGRDGYYSKSCYSCGGYRYTRNYW